MLRTTFIRLLALALALATVAGAAAAHAAAPAWHDKVDASVLTDAAAGPTEFIVYMATQADLSGAEALQTKEEKGTFVYNALRAAADATQAPLLAELSLLGVEHKSFWISNLIWARGDLVAVEAMATDPAVQHVYASGYGQLHTPVDVAPETAGKGTQSRAIEDNITQIGADAAWALGYRGQGVVVSGADTGVRWDHDTLKNAYRGWNGTTVDHDFNFYVGTAPNAICPDNNVACDDDAFLAGGHGTHTVGTILGDDGGSNQIGVAPDATWIACRNMNQGLGTIPSYLSCMQWLMAPTETDDVAGLTADPSKAPHVVNNSWGCVEACPPPALEDTLDASVAAGIFYVVSAGNDGSTCSSLAFPIGIYESAFSVGATNHRNDNIANFSSRGPILTDPTPAGAGPRNGPNISAPGVSVRSAVRNGGYSSLSGTSMAGPHVTGLVALVISANPDLSGNVPKIRQIIQDTSVFRPTNATCGGDTPTSRPNNAYGWGRIDALAAVTAAAADTDGDGVTDVFDNCSQVANPSQCDTDGDGFGNHCDADFNQNGVVNFTDLGELKAAYFSSPGDAHWNEHADLNCNGVVNFVDLGMLKSNMFGAPGPGETHPVQP